MKPGTTGFTTPHTLTHQIVKALELVGRTPWSEKSMPDLLKDMELLLELGRAAEAGESVHKFAKDRHAWRPADGQRGVARQVRDHGITADLYSEMLDRQGGGCGGCGSTDGLQIDHDHDTGVVRGLLCRDCNVALGILKDKPRRLVNLAAYVLRAPVAGPQSRRYLRSRKYDA